MTTFETIIAAEQDRTRREMAVAISRLERSPSGESLCPRCALSSSVFVFDEEFVPYCSACEESTPSDGPPCTYCAGTAHASWGDEWVCLPCIPKHMNDHQSEGPGASTPGGPDAPRRT